MPDLAFGPLLRYAGATEATVWVQTDDACEVEVLGCRSRTFRVGGHHYTLVQVSGLEPGAAREYEVLLDGERKWPEAGSPFPSSAIRTFERVRPSCSSSARAGSPPPRVAVYVEQRGG